MTTHHQIRPRLDVVDHRGATVRILDPEAIPRTRGVPLAVDGPWPRPIIDVGLTVEAPDGDAAGEGGVRLLLRGRVRHGGLTLAQALRTSVRIGDVSVPLVALPLVAVPTVGPLLFGAAVAGITHADLADADAETDADGRPADEARLPDAVRAPGTGKDVALTHVDGGGGVCSTTSLTFDASSTDPDAVATFVRLLLDVAALVARRVDDESFLAGRSFVLDAGGEAGAGGEGTDDHGVGPTGLDALGGLDDVVGQMRDIATSFRHPDVMAAWGARRPQGILLYGPPGTGKTTLAKALAVEAGAELMEIRTPDLLDKWVGASERNLRKVFDDARSATEPTVVLFDEFESVISYTGQPGDAASQMNNALAGLFKQEMNTLADENPHVMVVATTNFRGRIDESIVRAGRFDVKLEVPMPDAAARADILRTILRRVAAEHERPGRRILGDDIDVHHLAESTAGFSGADLDALVRRAQWSKAMDEARKGTPSAPISHQDLADATRSVRPSYRRRGPNLPRPTDS
ncbi:MAG TPA: ATP-binding protein [Acidimicrobiales bacterium]|nr:ATP-binding protein [Acidimicrobiales bacterium]